MSNALANVGKSGRYMALETMAPVSDNPIVMLSGVPGT
jgi:hypothetical protein